MLLAFERTWSGDVAHHARYPPRVEGRRIPTTAGPESWRHRMTRLGRAKPKWLIFARRLICSVDGVAPSSSTEVPRSALRMPPGRNVLISCAPLPCGRTSAPLGRSLLLRLLRALRRFKDSRPYAIPWCVFVVRIELDVGRPLISLTTLDGRRSSSRRLPCQRGPKAGRTRCR